MLKADSQGFLIGEVLDVSRAMLAGQQSGLEALARIDTNLSALLRRSGRTAASGVRSRASSFVVDALPAEPVGRTGSARIGAFGQAVPKVVIERAASAQARAVASVIPPAIMRDAHGRFLKRGEGGDGGRSPGERGAQGGDSPDRAGSSGDNRIVEAIKDAAIASSDRMDPMIEAAKEVWEPLGRGWRASFGQAAEKKKERWYRRIWQALTRKKGDAETQVAVAGSNGGLLSSIVAGLVGRMGGLISMIPAVLGRVFAPVAAVWAAWEVGQWIGGKFNDWLVSSGIQAKMFDWIDGMKAGWSSIMDRLKKLWGDNVAKPAQQALDAAADAAGKAYDGGKKIAKGAAEKVAAGAAATNTWVADKTGINVGGAATSATTGIKRLLGIDGTKRVYEMQDGTMEARDGGSVSWRNNNPGNLKFEHAGSADPTAKSRRTRAKALADAQRQYEGVVDLDQFGNAIFATPEQGRAAQVTYMKNKAPNKTIEEMLNSYARPDYSGQTHNTAYADSIYKFAKTSGLDLQGKKIGEMSPHETAILASAMQRFEGFKVGAVTREAVNASAPMMSFPSIRDMSKVRSFGPIPDISGMMSGVGPGADQPARSSGPDVVSQNVSDRAIAHIATGGIGMN